MAILNHGSTIRTTDGGQSTTTIVTASNIGTYGVAANSTYYIGTTQNVFNRASGAQTLTGVSIDGNAANITAYTINQNVGTGNTPSFAGIVSSAVTNYAFLQTTDTNNFWITPGNNNWGLYFETSAGGLLGGTGDSNRLGFVGAGSARFYVDLNNGNGWFGGSLTANTDSRAPIFYDSANTSYYLDPNNTGTSMVVAGKIFAAKGNFSDASGSGAVLEAYNTVATNATTAIIRQTTAGGNGNQDIGLLVDIQGAGDTDRIANFRYYDGSTYTSRMAIMRGGNVGIGTTSPGYTLTVNGTIAYTPSAGNPVFIGNDGTYGASGTGRYVALGFGGLANSANKIFAHNMGEDGLYICSATSRSIFFRAGGGATDHVVITSGGNLGVATLSADTNLQVVGHVHVGNQTTFENAGGWNKTIYLDGLVHARMRILGSAYASGKNSATETNIWVDNSVAPYSGLTTNAGSFTINAGFTTLTNSARSPIFYDSDNTAYYVDAASTSVFNAFTGSHSGGSVNVTSVNGAYLGVNNTTNTNGYGISLYNGASAGEPTYGLMFQGTGTFGTYGSVTGDWATYFTMNNDNTRGWIFRKTGGGGNTASISAGGIITASSDVRAPIFYDSGDTTYYVDPAGTSRVSTLYVAGTLADSASLNGRIILSGNLHIDAYGAYDIYCNYYSGRRFRTFKGVGTGAETFRADTDGIVYAYEQLRTPILYDHNDTNYYLNPASSSVLNTLSMAGTITGALDATASFTGGVCTAASYNYVLNGANDTGNKLVIFVNGSTRTADGGVNALTIRNDGGAFVLGSASYLTSILGSSVTINGNTALTSASTLTAGNLSGTIPSGVLGNSTLYVGTTAIALNRSSASQTLTGISIDGNAATVTNGVYTTGAQTIGGTKTFSDGIIVNGATYYTFNKPTTTNYQTVALFGSASAGLFLTTDSAIIGVGAYYNTGWIATATSGRQIDFAGGNFTFGAFSGATVGGAASWGTVAQLSSAGVFSATGDFRAPIFYDSNNTAYYVDAASTSILDATRHNSIVAGSTSGMSSAGAIAVYSGGSPYISFHDGTTARTAYFQELSGRFYFGEVTYTESEGSFRAPLFYDSNNTAYYLDPASTSNLNNITAAGTLTVTNIAKNSTSPIVINSGLSASLGLRVYYDMNLYNTLTFTDSAWNSQGSIFGSSSVVTINAATATTSFVKYAGYSQEGGSFRAPIFYDSDNTAYYIDGASGSKLKYLQIDGDWGSSPFGSGHESFTIRSTYASMVQRQTNGALAYWLHHIAGDGAYNLYGGRGATDGNSWDWAYRAYPSQDGNYVEFNTSARAQIFYDRNDTTYYLDPANSGTSLLVAGKVGIGITSPGALLEVSGTSGDGVPTFKVTSTAAAGTFNWAGTILNSSLGSSRNFILFIGKAASTKNAAYIGYNHSGTDGSNTNFLTLGHYASDNLLNILGNGNVGIGTTSPSQKLHVVGTAYSDTDFRAPIFYDSNDTAYYGDFASTSVLNRLNYQQLRRNFASTVYTGTTGSRTVKTFSGVLVGGSAIAGNSAYTVIETTIPQSAYQMGGFTIKWFENYNNTNAKTSIEIAGYWNPVSNGGFIGFEYTTSNPNVQPTIRVGANASGNTVFILDHFSSNYTVIIARDLWLGYDNTDGEWGTGWTMVNTTTIAAYSNIVSAVLRVGPTLTGTGASGSWGISVTGSSASCTGNAATVTTNANLTGHITSVGNATSLGSFTSAQLLAALTDETGTGANVFATSPTLVSPILGTPTSGNLANCTFPTLNQNTTGTSSNITAYTINQSVGTANSPTFATLQLTRLNFGATGATPYAAAAGEGTGNGITFGGDEAGAGYRIFTSMENWNSSGNYSKLTLNWHTGIKIGAYTNYGGIRFYNNAAGATNPTPSEIFSIGRGDSNVRVENTIYAQSFYDINNTAYYLDPAAGTSLRIAGAIVGDHAAWTGEQNKIQWHSSHLYFQNTSDGYFIFRKSNGAEPFQLRISEEAGYATGSWRAPIFYDSNNTAYYLDPAGTSILNAITYSGVQFWQTDSVYAKGTPSYGYRFNNYSDSINAFIINNSGDTTAYSSSRAPIFYDSNDTGYYTDPAGTTILNIVRANSYVQKSTSQSLSGTVGCTIDVNAAGIHVLTLAASTTISSFTYNNRVSNPSVNTIMLVIKYGGTASITWTNVLWANGVTPSLTSASGYADVYMLTSYQGGAATPSWIGTVVAQALVSTSL